MGLLQYVFVPFLKLFVREARGFDRIPAKGPVILVANHASYVDGPMILFFTEWYRNRLVHGIQLERIFNRNWFTRFLFGTIFRQIPTGGSVEKALELLNRNHVLLLFPEGGRTHDGKLQKATHTGLGVLASQSGAPVIPIGIQGTYGWWSRHRALPTFKPRCISVRVGKQMRYTGTASKQSHLAFQRKVMQAVARLAHMSYPY